MAHLIPINQIVPLEEYSQEIALQYNSRDLVEQHVRNLMLIPLEDLPPITVILTEKGYALIDGAHRVECAKRQKIDWVNAEFVDQADVHQLVKRAYMANQLHGLPDKVSRRVDFAMWLVSSEGLSQYEAARVAKCAESTLTRRRQKLIKQEHTTEEVPIKDERSRPIIRFIKALEGLKDYSGSDDDWFADLRVCLSGNNAIVEDFHEKLTSLAETYSQTVNR